MENKQAFQYLQHLASEKRDVSQSGDADKEPAFIGIRIQGDTCYLDVDSIREIIPNPTIAPVGHAQSWLQGLIKVQGEIYSVVDLAGFLGKKPVADKNSFVIALAQEGGNYALLVSRVLGMTKLAQAKKTEEETYFDKYQSDIREISVLSVQRMLESSDFANVSIF